MASLACTDGSQFCLSTPHLSEHQLAYGAFPVEHCTGTSNSIWSNQNLSSLHLQLASLHYSPLPSVFPISVDVPPSVMEFDCFSHCLSLSRSMCSMALLSPESSFFLQPHCHCSSCGHSICQLDYS